MVFFLYKSMGMVFGYQVIFVFVDGHCINTLHAFFILKFPKSFHKFKVQNFKLYFDQQCFEFELVNPNFDPLDPSNGIITQFGSFTILSYPNVFTA